jgi:hypothetical protein
MGLYVKVNSGTVATVLTAKEKRMHDDDQQLHQLMLERQERLEDAYDKARLGIASEDDWDVIRYECGLPKRPIVSLDAISISRSE